ncbi:rCG40631 [Rattus norvegicus]|uniref:RCG40631 n=1 Tax=Rattus norvegicus TaxID=10116 RepID=A6I5Z9_RAT|nr:rCG40631 [Rattus norvegicus]
MDSRGLPGTSTLSIRMAPGCLQVEPFLSSVHEIGKGRPETLWCC